MKHTTRGAARRRETTETVRRRLAALFSAALRSGPSRVAAGTPTGTSGETRVGASGGGADTMASGPPTGPATQARSAAPGAAGAAGAANTVAAPVAVAPGARGDRPSSGHRFAARRFGSDASPGTGRSPRRRAVRDGPYVPAPGAGLPPPETSSPFGAAADPFTVPPDLPKSPSARRLAFSLPAGLMLDRRAALGLAALLLLAVGYAVQHFWLSRPEPVAVPTVSGSAASATGGPPSSTVAGTTAPHGAPAPTVVVDVAGKVQHPGLRTLPTGSRVADALRAAGGALPGTDTDSLNLARVLSDGEQILVGLPVGQGAPGTTTGGLVSLNRATAEQLDTLPGVGPTLAQRILQYRQAHGPFRSVDQLRQVPGIGQRKFDDIKGLLTL
ncbi:ComEA family DNA-binding protein [Kitasatospora sp. DSM 101779]|nr:ComEA family DNA-binding protein [Kitasatospora sp. DSM 101779]